MQNKGLFNFFAILFAVVSIYQISFTFVANSIKDDAKVFAKGNAEKERKYLDSIGNVPVFNLGFASFTFNEVLDKQINKGLDLEGGINVILEISVKDILKGLSNNSKDPIFNQALIEATKNRQGNQNYLDVFFDEFEKLSAGKVKLSSPDIFSNRNLSDEINFQMTNDQVRPIIKRKVDESIQSAFGVLRERIDKFGVTQPNIQRLGESGRILVELPGAKDVDRIKKLLQSTAQLEFWETYKVDELGNYLMAVNEQLKKTEISKETIKEEAPKSELDSLLTDKSKDSVANTKGKNPLFDKLIGGGQQGSPVLGYFSLKDTATINGYFKRDDIKSLLPAEQRYVKFVWGKPTKNQPDAVELYALKGNRDNIAPMSGGVVVDASESFDQLGRPSVTMQMNGKGAKIWEEMTKKAYEQQSNIAIVLDNIVYSAPGVSSGPIAGGRSEISGSFEIAETKDLANVLRAGKLPAAAEIVQSEVVGPSLGQEAIDSGMISFVIGLVAVLLWMIVYYGKTGVYANIALAVNILFIFGILASLGAVLTLPGIAGIVLTIGMAVDANVIIYERAKEELNAGKTVDEAVHYAYTWKGAMSSIFDANITTGLTALILFVFGTGPIKGFATTLLIGIGTSLFSAIFVTRLLLDWGLGHATKFTFSTALTKNLFKNINVDFMAKKKIAYVFSGLLIIGSLFSLFTNGLNQGVDFVGGRTFQVRFEKPVVPSEVNAKLVKVFGSAEAKTFGDANQLKITTKYKVDIEGEGVDKEVNELLYKALTDYLPSGYTYDQFVNSYEGKTVGILQATKVGPTIAADIKTDSFYAVFGSLIGIFLYLLISYRKWQYGLGAVVALAHDVIIVLGIFSATYQFMPFNMEVDQAFIAAILTVIGYSINDTVIVFDRIREFLSSRSTESFNAILNKSLSTTLSRTINTSATTLVVLIAIFLFGGESIRGFVFAILVGILVGTYSSLFIATPILSDSISDKEKESK